jgi:hypothetical protein
VCSAPRRIPQLHPAHLLVRCLAGQGRAKPDSSRAWIRHCRRSPPYSPRNLAARARDYSGRAPASGSRALARGPGLGEVAARRWCGWRGSGAGGAGRRLTARNLRPYAYLNRRRRASLIRPPKDPSAVSRETMRDFGTIVRCRGRSSGWLAWPRGRAARAEPGPGRLRRRGAGRRPAC